MKFEIWDILELVKDKGLKSLIPNWWGRRSLEKDGLTLRVQNKFEMDVLNQDNTINKLIRAGKIESKTGQSEYLNQFFVPRLIFTKDGYEDYITDTAWAFAGEYGHIA